MVAKRPFGEELKLAIYRVSRDLRIPNLGVEASDEALYPIFNLLDTAHTKLYLQSYQVGTGALTR